MGGILDRGISFFLLRPIIKSYSFNGLCQFSLIGFCRAFQNLFAQYNKFFVVFNQPVFLPSAFHQNLKIYLGCKIIPMNKIFDFFNKTLGTFVFLIFLLLIVEHFHHGHFWRKEYHKHFSSQSSSTDSLKATLDSSVKK